MTAGLVACFAVFFISPCHSAPFNPADSIAPAAILSPGDTSVDFTAGAYRLSYSRSGVLRARYEIDTADPDVRQGLLKVRESVTGSVPLSRGGARYRALNGALLTPFELSQQASVQFSHEISTDGFVRLHYDETVGGKITHRRVDLQIRGRTLVIRTYAVVPDSASAGNYAGFAFGRSENTPNPSGVVIPYMELFPIVMAGAAGSRYFYSAYIDWTKSGSNYDRGREGPALHSASSYSDSYYSQYIAAEGGYYPALDETAYLTVSDEVADTFVKVHRDASLYRRALDSIVVWDTFGASLLPKNPLVDSFKIAREVIRKLGEFGMENVSILFHPWQNLGYDCGLPKHYPANPDYGGDGDFRAFLGSAFDLGFRVAVHENYFHIYENSGAYWAGGANVARKPDGSFQGGTSRRNCPVNVSYDVASDKMAEYAAIESSLTKDNYKTNAGFLDVTTQLKAEALVDYSSANPKARTLRAGYENNLRLNQLLHDVYKGPLFGEGGSDPFTQAGSVDGLEAQILNREFSPLIPDFELKSVKPLMANHGMGYAGRWIGAVPSQIVGLDTRTFPFDKYRAQQIAYGHAGFMHDATFNNDRREDFYKYWIKEYYTFRALQEQYLSSQISSILYRDGQGALIPLSQALSSGIDLTKAQLREEYANGLVVYVNHHQTSSWTVTAAGKDHVLPPNGWLAANPTEDFLQYSTVVDANGEPDAAGIRVDYVRSRDYIMADARGAGAAVRFGSDYFGNLISTSRFIAIKPRGWSLSEQSDGSFVASGSGGAPGTLVGAFSASSGGSVDGVLGDGRRISLQVPSGAFPASVRLAVATVSGHPACGQAASALRLTALPALQPLRPLRLSLSFMPAEAAGLDIGRLALVRYEPISGRCVTLPTTINAESRTATASVNHLSDFQLAQVDPSSGLNSARAFPNPVFSGRHSLLTIDRVPADARVRVFTLGGEKVFEGATNASGLLTWNLRNFANREVASGVYLILVESGPSRSVLKVAVVR